MKQIPNLLSALRVALAPFIFYFLGTRRFRTALMLFAVAGVSDALDGWIARRFAAASRVGAYLDPLADKILLSGSFLTLALTFVIPWSLTFLVLGRDLLILLFVVRALMRKTRRDFPPSLWGKLSTTGQILYVLAVVAFQAGFGYSAMVVLLGWVTAALTVYSGIDYARHVTVRS